MATETDIANGALALLKAPRLDNMTDNTEQARICRLRFPVCRDALLELAPWHFASIRVGLQQSGITPASEWGYQFPLPSNPWCLKVRDPNPTYIPWEIGFDPVDGRVLLAQTPTMKIRYTARITDCMVWSPLAVLALTYMLASELAMALTGDMTKAKGWQEAYLRTVSEAIMSDAQEGSPVVVPAPTALSAWR
jgi:hypothetical protein